MHRIDIHHHPAPPEFARTLDRLKTNQQALVDWNVSQSLDDMDRAGIATAMTSLGHPGVWFGDDQAARGLARHSNEFAARLRDDHPGRFGVFAVMPMPDVDGSLRELEYAFDTLKADGLNLITSYDGRWLGDPLFAPVMAEMNRRKAVVHVHPTIPPMCKGLIPDVPDHLIEFQADTSRAIVHLLLSGTTTRFPDIRFIFSHAGGFIPFMVERLTWWEGFKKDIVAERVPNGVMAELGRLFYDTAFSANPHAFASLLKLVPASQILLGSDFPFRTGPDNVAGLTARGLPAADLLAIERDNALQLLPQLAGKVA
jgi:predicted TIM-barrel fold metal-dependent hydrolase